VIREASEQLKGGLVGCLQTFDEGNPLELDGPLSDLLREVGRSIMAGPSGAPPQKRLKLPAACWRPESLNPMLAFRVLRENGWWHDIWASIQNKSAA
jgi:hypothetical protein